MRGVRAALAQYGKGKTAASPKPSPLDPMRGLLSQGRIEGGQTGGMQTHSKRSAALLRTGTVALDRPPSPKTSILPRANLRSLTSALSAPPKVQQHIVSRVRSRLVHIHAVPPFDIPSAEKVQAALPGEELLRYAALMGERCSARVLAALPTQLHRPARTLSSLVDTPNVRDNELHDGYFCVVRVNTTDMASHVEGIILAAQALRSEMRSGSAILETTDFGAIADGVELAFTLATGIRPGRIALWPSVPRTVLTEAMIARRWMRGHQLFLVITQAMIASLNRLGDIAGQARNDTDMEAIVEQLVVLLRAAAGSMRLTGDFPPEIYDSIIRPSMAPPELPDGFSGIFSSDHRFLVSRLREVAPLLGGLKDRMHAAHALLVKAFSDLYDDHITVCANFVSSEKNSLLMADGARCTALEQLGKFKKSRLRLLGRS